MLSIEADVARPVGPHVQCLRRANESEVESDGGREETPAHFVLVVEL